MATVANKRRFYEVNLSTARTVPETPELGNPTKLSQLVPTVQSLIEVVQYLKEENLSLHDTVNKLLFENSKLKSDIDNIDQYSRRENVCFSNLKIDDDNTCPDQIVKLCGELDVDFETSDLVAAHPLPSGKPRSGTNGKPPRRFIARFKNRGTAQAVLSNRKRSKNISPQSKKKLFNDPSKGVAVQPNITPLRTALLAQVKDAVRQHNLNSCWVDVKNCNIMLRCAMNGRPVPIFSTIDLCVCVPDFKPSNFIGCVDPKFLFPMPMTAPCMNSIY